MKPFSTDVEMWLECGKEYIRLHSCQNTRATAFRVHRPIKAGAFARMVLAVDGEIEVDHHVLLTEGIPVGTEVEFEYLGAVGNRIREAAMGMDADR